MDIANFVINMELRGQVKLEKRHWDAAKESVPFHDDDLLRIFAVSAAVEEFFAACPWEAHFDETQAWPGVEGEEPDYV